MGKREQDGLLRPIRVGTAGWAIPRACAGLFPPEGSALQRYAAELSCAEINSSFYRPHRPSTYARWAESTPDYFQFSVKLPKAISHGSGLVLDRAQFESFLEGVGHLGAKLGPLLLQLPPKQGFDPGKAGDFLGAIREVHPQGAIVLEPRHAGWFTPEADEVLRTNRVCRVIADPAPVSLLPSPPGAFELVYRRLHGSPRVYYSAYTEEQLEDLAKAMRAEAGAWCMFDNTASGAAAANAMELVRKL